MTFSNDHNSALQVSVTHPFERKFVEYFAGIGLVRLGLEQAGWQVVFANDFDPNKYEMYQGAFGEAPYYDASDVFKLRAEIIPPAALATCSFPCVDLSVAGNQIGLSGKHSSAFWGFIRILRLQEKQSPPIVLLENVPGWLHSSNGQDFRITIQALNDLGYACDVFELDALRFTPQSRPRVFVIGSKLLEPDTSVANLLRRSSSLMSKRLRDAIRSNQDLSWVKLQIPEPPALRHSGLTNEVVESLPDDDPRWWRDEEVSRHLDMMAPTHRQRVQELSVKPQISYRTIFRRMRVGSQRAEVRHTDTAGCLRTARGGSSKQILVKAGTGKVRMRYMTPRECARLQGVPDTYRITVPDLRAWNGFGDAVCVPAFTWIGENILNPLLLRFTSGNTDESTSAIEEYRQYPLFNSLS